MEMKFVIKMVLGKFREHPVPGGNEVVSGKGKLRGRPVFVANYKFHENDTGKISRASCVCCKLKF